MENWGITLKERLIKWKQSQVYVPIVSFALKLYKSNMMFQLWDTMGKGPQGGSEEIILLA